MLFQVVCSILFSVLAFHTPSADWLDLSTANQHLSNNRFLLVTQRAKQSTSSEGAAKTGLENDVRLFVLFCFTHFYVWQVVDWEFDLLDQLRYSLSRAHWLSNISRGSDSKKSSPRRRNTIFLRFSQQLPRVRVGLWKGFLSWQGPSTRLTPCMVASRTTEKRGHRCAFVEYVCTCFCYSKTWEGQGLLCPSVRPSASPPPSCVHYNQS